MGVIKCFNEDCRHSDFDEVDHCSKPLTKIQECPDADIREDADVRDTNWYLRELRSNECACGRSKSRRKSGGGTSFCYGCFILLPTDLQSDLYCRIGDGYENAYETSIRHLTEIGRI